MYAADVGTTRFYRTPVGRGWLLARAALAALVLVCGAGLTACSRDSVTAAEEEDRQEVLIEPAQPGLEPVVLAEQPDSETVSTGFPMDDATQTGTTLDGPCPGTIGNGLIITPDPVQLLGGQKRGAVDIRNCDLEPITWTASTKPWVALAETQAIVPNGATYRMLFTVNTTSLPIGEYTFKIKFVWPGHSTYIDVDGVKLGGLVAPGGPTPSPAPTVGGLIAPGPSGCAAKCIVKAWLTPVVGSADVKLDLRTNVSAKMWVRVDTEAPQYTAGKPYFSSPDVNLASGNEYRKQWNPVLKPLQADTTYHIIVVAEDLSKGVSYQVGTFKTKKPINGISNSEPGGCSANCVKSALLTPIPNSPNVDLNVTAYVPVRMRVKANGVMVASTHDEFRAEWSATLDLDAGKNYEIELKVTDEQGLVQKHKVSISTPKPVQSHATAVIVRFLDIVVSDDADNSGLNVRGELRFRFEVDGERAPQLDVGEMKVKAPETVALGGRSIGVSNPADRFTIRVQGLERDNNQPGFCSTGSPLFPETAGRRLIKGCYEMEWNTAEIVIDLNKIQMPGALPACYGFSQDDICLAFPSTGGEDPRFTVRLSVEIVD